MEAFNLPNILESLREKVRRSEMTVHQAAVNLYHAGWTTSIDDEATRDLLRLHKHEDGCNGDSCDVTALLENAGNDAPSKQRFIEWEMANNPHVYDKPRCREFIDRQTLTHVVCNVDRPEGVSEEDFGKVLNAVAETLNLFPYLAIPEAQG